jgi:hypothetical protein
MESYCFGDGFYSLAHEFVNIFLALFLISSGIRGEGRAVLLNRPRVALSELWPRIYAGRTHSKNAK